MCIRDRFNAVYVSRQRAQDEDPLEPLAEALRHGDSLVIFCLLYTSDAPDERSSVDLGGRRILKKKSCSYIAYHELSRTRLEQQLSTTRTGLSVLPRDRHTRC